jgi:hypothetical protein
MHYIKEIFLGKPIDYIHSQFTRYGKGNFQVAAITIKNGPAIRCDGSVHYVNIVGEIIASSSQQEFEVDGSIHAKRQIKVPLKAGKEKVKGGLHSVEIKDKIHSDGLRMVYNDYKDGNILLSLTPSSGKWRLSPKKKMPRPGGGLDEKFWNAVLEPSALDGIMNEILFDVKDKNFKEARITHEVSIEELVGSPELKKDAARFRLEAKRKGKIKRTVDIDGRKTETTHEFIA